jgi:hypothetical protein
LMRNFKRGVKFARKPCRKALKRFGFEADPNSSFLESVLVNSVIHLQVAQ